MADEMYEQMGLGTASRMNIGISGGVLVGNIGGEGVIRYADGHGIHAVPERSAFNKNFGTTGTTVARGDHTHNEIINNMSYIFSDIITLASGVTSIRYNSDDIKAQAPFGTSYINPNISVTVYNVTSNTTMRNIVLNNGDVQVTMAYNSYVGYKTCSLNAVLINNLTTLEEYMIMIEFSTNILRIDIVHQT